jgi:hypothetical protein
MILRSVIKHFRQQEWTAIAIDFLIVVIGVFIGIQVSNWNTERLERERAEAYSQRLTVELQIEYDYAFSLITYMRTLLDAGNEAYFGLSGEQQMDNSRILISAFRASQYNWYERRRSAFDEIVSSGALSLIPSTELRETAIGIYSTPLFEIMREEGQTAEYRKLFRQSLGPAHHESLRQSCGDIEENTGARQLTMLTISYTCKTELGDEILAKEVDALRQNAAILPALKLRNAQVAGRISDLEITMRTLGMDRLFNNKNMPR